MTACISVLLCGTARQSVGISSSRRTRPHLAFHGQDAVLSTEFIAASRRIRRVVRPHIVDDESILVLSRIQIYRAGPYARIIPDERGRHGTPVIEGACNENLCCIWSVQAEGCSFLIRPDRFLRYFGQNCALLALVFAAFAGWLALVVFTPVFLPPVFLTMI